MTSTRNTGPYVVSSGQTFYRNRAYVSLATAFANNSCGYVGGQHPGTMLTLKSSDLYSVGGYHHEFADVGYSVNFADFSSVPAVAYYLGRTGGGGLGSWEYSGTRYTYGTDFINGMDTVDLAVLNQMVGNGGLDVTSDMWIWDQAYAPTLLVPLQIRHLETAWSTCSLNLLGLYDPPIALTQSVVYPVPTQPQSYLPTATSAAPVGAPTRPIASPTAAPFATFTLSSAAQSTPGSSEYDPGSAYPTQHSVESSFDPSSSLATISGDPAHVSVRQTDPTAGSTLSGGSESQLPPSASPNPGDGSPFSQSNAIGPSPVGGLLPSTTNAESVLSSAEQTFANANPASDDPGASPNGAPPSSADPVTFTADGTQHTVAVDPSSSGVYVVDGSQTVTQGGAAVTVNGVPVSAGSSGDISAGSQSIHTSDFVPPAAPNVATGMLPANGQTFTVAAVPSSSGLYVVDGSRTITYGSSALAVNGVPISVGASDAIVAGSQSIILSADLSGAVSGADESVFTEQGHTYTIAAAPTSSGVYVVDGSSMLTAGHSAITVDGVPISADPSGAVVAGSQSITLSPAASTPAASGEGGTFSADGHTYSIAAVSGSSGVYAVDGSYTLTQGAAPLTISGVALSAGSSGRVVAVSAALSSGNGGSKSYRPALATNTPISIPAHTGYDPSEGQGAVPATSTKSGSVCARVLTWQMRFRAALVVLVVLVTWLR